MKKVNVRLQDRSYPIYIGSNSLQELANLIHKHKLHGIACIVTQKNIWSHWGSQVKKTLDLCGISYKVHVTNPRLKSEQAKNISEVISLAKSFTSTDAKGKGMFVIALGGGVIGDLAGFAASIYRRGTPYIQVPTTLTAQVDSSIGGKTAVDLPDGKNLLGTIYQPSFVLIDPNILRTQPEGYYKDGLAEVVKYGVIRDKGLFEKLEKQKSEILQKSPRILAEIITACARIKSHVVSRDEFDKKEIRMILNFGHTIGHAIETAASYASYTHGEAISVGMAVITEISDSLSVLRDPGLSRRLDQLLTDFGLPVLLDKKVSLQKIKHALKFDKKNTSGTNRFVLVEALGKTAIAKGVPEDIVMREIAKRRS